MHFRTSIKLTLLLLALAALFTRLGWWQLERKNEKELLFDSFENAPVMKLEQALAQQQLFARVQTSGRYDPDRHILLDNRILHGRAGVHVLTPFRTDSGRWILVNRGWKPMPPDRRSLPDVATDATPATISGILNKPSLDGQRLGDADSIAEDQWPQLVTYLDLTRWKPR